MAGAGWVRPSAGAGRGGTSRNRARAFGRALAAVAVLLPLPAIAVLATPAAGAAAAAAPASPSAPVCGDTTLLSGPAVPPAGAVRVDPGKDLVALTEAHPPGTTFWLAPGTHTLPSDEAAHVVPKKGNTYVGGPGAVLDGQRINGFAFGMFAGNVTIRHLTIQRFGAAGKYLNEGAVNHEHADNWTIEYNTIRENAGAGVVVGSGNTVRFNCLVDNGQYGFNVYKAVGVTLHHNEIARNNADDWERRVPGCGCSGAGKFWASSGVTVTDNWVHHNRGPALWADTNNVGFRIEGNYINDNDGEGVYYELSYNARIAGNTLVRNALGKGRTFASAGNNFPVGAIYLSESGGDARVNNGVYATLEVTGNLLQDNWGGVVLAENADRFCGSPANTSGGFCTLGGAATLETCVPGKIEKEPYRSDCRWKTQNVRVQDNDVQLDKTAIGCNGTPCGQMGLLSNFGTYPSWSPYQGRVVQDAVTFGQNNRFGANRYVGDWRWTAWEQGRTLDFAAWQASPYNQDAGSTLDAGTAAPNANLLDADTAGLEGSIGQWVRWFSADVQRSTAAAHGGAHSLGIGVTAPHGWGVALRSPDGFPASPGPKVIGLWALAGSGGGLSATLTVRWRNGSGAEVGADTVTVTLGPDWMHGSRVVVAPAGTSRFGLEISNSSGRAGDSLFVDDVSVTDTTSAPPSSGAPANALDGDTSTLEGSTGRWVPWFSTTVARSPAQAHGGAHSLEVGITAPHGWGVTLQNWPGFPVSPGSKVASFWARAGKASGALSATMTVHWRDTAGTDLKTDVVTLSGLDATWRQASATLVAPDGTTRVGVDFSNSLGGAGDSLYLDDIVVAPPPNALDADTAGMEDSAGQWVAWFSSSVARSATQAHTGAHSLEVAVTAPHGWGVTLRNYPGFAAAPGNKTVSFWGRAGTVTGGGLAATMAVHWRDASGADLRTDRVNLTLTDSWRQASTDVVAPAGTAKVSVDFSNSLGGAGDSLFIDDVSVVDGASAPPPPPPPSPNALDADTATLEGSAGQWVPWFSSSVARSTAQAHGGAASLRVDITAAFGWGIAMRNWPGAPTGPGPKRIGFWALAGSGSGLGVTMTVRWRSVSGADLRVDVLSLPALSGAWQRATADVVAPAGTAAVSVELSHGTGGPGDTLYLDDLEASDR